MRVRAIPIFLTKVFLSTMKLTCHAFLACTLLFCTARAQVIRTPSNASIHPLIKNFRRPPVEARPRALWPWVNGNFSLSQISREIEEAAAKGMGGFDIWDVGSMMNPGQIMPDGPPFLSDPSLHGIAHAVREADRVGLDIGLITSSSWNAGGTWIRPEHGAMGLFTSDTIVSGPATFSASLPFPVVPEKYGREKALLQKDVRTGLPTYYKHVAILAYPLNADSTIANPSNIVRIPATNGDEQVKFNVPDGKWKIVRYVCTPTGQPLAVPSPRSNGLVLDHFSAEAQRVNMRYVIDRLKSVLGNLRNRSLKYLYEDSYEVNSAVWTPGLPEAFEKKNGYSLIPFLPVLQGFTVGSRAMTEGFLFDFTKTLSDLIIANHYAEGTRLAKAEGLGFYAEAGGPGKPIHNVPFEDLKALGSLTVPRGEFWNQHKDWQKLQIVKGISSAAHIYNQKYVEAEAFTSVWLWQEGPGQLKPLADRAMCEGLNRFIYHTFPHSPPESGTPGWIYNFGTLINTTNGWWDLSDGFHYYLGRCSYLLQEGNFVGDVAYYYGDRAPNFVPMKSIDPSLGEGYDYDVVNSEAILTKMTVRNGRIYLPHGQSYAVLVLPQEREMNPDVLQKIEQLILGGATVIGPRPLAAHGLRDSAKSAGRIKTLAARIWANCDSVRVNEHRHGPGRVVWGRTIREVLGQMGISPDVEVTVGNAKGNVDFIHRRTTDADIYFVRNTGESAIEGIYRFRVTEGVPYWFDAGTGSVMPVTQIKREKDGISLGLALDAQASGFVVFLPAEEKGAPPERTRSGAKVSGAAGSTAGIKISGSASDMGESAVGSTRMSGTTALRSNVGYAIAGAFEIKPLARQALPGPWELRFAFSTGAPVSDTLRELESWHLHRNEGIKHYSGTVSYRTSFDWSHSENAKQVVMLEAGAVREIARVYVNGIEVGYHWHPSQRLDITRWLKTGRNELIIDVANSLNNRLVGDGKRPEDQRQTRSNISKLPNAWMKPFAEASLLPAGLLGPVTINTYPLLVK